MNLEEISVADNHWSVRSSVDAAKLTKGQAKLLSLAAPLSVPDPDRFHGSHLPLPACSSFVDPLHSGTGDGRRKKGGRVKRIFLTLEST
jgi:hypothetical protein